MPPPLPTSYGKPDHTRRPLPSILPPTMRPSLLLTLATFALAISAPADSPYDPSWAASKPKRTIQHSDPNGDALVKAIAALQPGDHLEIASGTYSINRMWDVLTTGTASAPVWITAAKNAKVIITRPDDQQNVINIGQAKPVQFLCLRGLEFTGGSHGIRIGQVSNFWLDQCHIHHTGEVCVSANSANTSHLHLTRNHIHHGAGHAEGFYLGANNGDHIMSESIIALNHVHDCRGEQGDGIEVKQGSWGNLIAENHVHDTNYPCITVYGTNGKPVNTIERNLCYNSADHVMQVQGDALVRNNVLINGAHAGFASTDHQGKSANLKVVHNTIVNRAHAFRANSWNDREGMVLANNVLYSTEENAILFTNGSSGVTSAGNVVLGNGPRTGCSIGRGLTDLPSLSPDGSKHDATPAPDAPFNSADPRFLEKSDFLGHPRSRPVSGAIAR